ncbi:MAG: LysM peptidoglycan-binding domain-containing protein [Clostridiales bacterium]|nr:LysM peptidoglycan-binding domain-containing protein [Clostridiales bacterium]
MIETIYSNENNNSKSTNRIQPAFKMPKNIRQVGKVSGNRKIYVEDYVMTFIKQLAGEEYSGCKVAVLIGQYVKLENCRNIFISGAVEVEGIDTSGDIEFTNDNWTNIYEMIKKYFVDMEIVGWFLGGPGYLLEDEDKICKAHIDNFAGQDKTLLTYDNLEKEEAFLIFENNRLKKQDGYYIYYEKNEEMQTYMVDHKKVVTEENEFEDRVTKEIRNVIQNKRPVQEENKGVTRLMYAAGTLLAVIILVVGAAMLNNHEQMKNMQDTLNYLTMNLSENNNGSMQNNKLTTAPTSAEINPKDRIEEEGSNSAGDLEAEEGSLNVEVLPGGVKPLEKEEDDNRLPGEELAQEPPNQKEEKENESSKAGEESQEVIQEEVKYYTVQLGDTLAGISYKLYNSANYITKIMELNNIQDENVIYAGQRLIVP